MNLLDRYVTEIGKGLPRKSRADIETEIRSTLQDMLDERSARTGKPVDEAMITELLKEYGAPAKVAASYRGPQYIVGPKMFPLFELVLKIVLAVLVGVSLAGFGFSFVSHSSGPEFVQALGKWGAQLYGMIISAFGSIVLVFAILERVLPASKFEKEKEEWDPSELEREPDPAEVKPAERIVGIGVTVLGLVILNVYPNLVGPGFVSDGRWTFIPALSAAFFRYLPWINVLGLLHIGLNLVLLRAGQWKTYSRAADLALDAAGAVLAGFMLAGPSLVDLPASKLAGTPLAPAAAQLTPLFSVLPTIVLTIIVIVTAVDVAKALYRMLSRPALLAPKM